MITNYSFETVSGTSPNETWSGWTATRVDNNSKMESSTVAYVGSKSVKIAPTASTGAFNHTLLSTTAIDLNPLDTYNTFIYARGTSTGSAKYSYFQIIQYDSSNNWLKTTNILADDSIPVPYTKYETTITPEATAAKCFMKLTRTGSFTTTPETHYFDASSLKARPRHDITITSPKTTIDRSKAHRFSFWARNIGPYGGTGANTTQATAYAVYRDAGATVLRTDTLAVLNACGGSDQTYSLYEFPKSAFDAPAGTTTFEFKLVTTGSLTEYTATGANIGWYMDDFEVYESSTANECISFDLDPDVHPSVNTFLNRCFISGYDDNYCITEGDGVTIAPEYPAKTKYNCVHNNRLWLAGDPENPSFFYWTSLLADDPIDYVDPLTNFAAVDPDDGDVITAIAGVGANLTIFKRTATFSFWGDPDVEGSSGLKRISGEVGCASHRSIVNMDSYLIYFAGPREGVYIFDGTNLNRISDRIAPLLEKVVNPENSFAMLYKDRYHLFCQDADAAYPYNNRVYVYSLKTKSWVVYKGIYAASGTVRDIGYEQVLAGTAKNEGYVYELERGYNDNGAAIDAYFTTGDMNFRGKFVEKRIRKLAIWAKDGTSGDTLAVSYGSDRPNTNTATTIDITPSGDLWGTGVWGTAVWTNHQELSGTVVPTTHPAEAANFFRVKVEENTADKEMEVYGLGILERERRVRA
jgi:hypothetical protein